MTFNGKPWKIIKRAVFYFWNFLTQTFSSYIFPLMQFFLFWGLYTSKLQISASSKLYALLVIARTAGIRAIVDVGHPRPFAQWLRGSEMCSRYQKCTTESRIWMPSKKYVLTSLMRASLNKIIKRCRRSGDVKSRVFGCENNIWHNPSNNCYSGNIVQCASTPENLSSRNNERGTIERSSTNGHTAYAKIYNSNMTRSLTSEHNRRFKFD